MGGANGIANAVPQLMAHVEVGSKHSFWTAAKVLSFWRIAPVRVEAQVHRFHMPQDAVAYLTRYGSFQGNRDAAYVSQILAHTWNALELGETARAHALLGTGLA